MPPSLNASNVADSEVWQILKRSASIEYRITHRETKGSKTHLIWSLTSLVASVLSHHVLATDPQTENAVPEVETHRDTAVDHIVGALIVGIHGAIVIGITIDATATTGMAGDSVL